MKLDIFQYQALFIDLELNFETICAAQIVNSMEEARKLYLSNQEETLGERYNRFALCCLTVPGHHTSFDFSIFINPVKQELYVIFDDITNDNMNIDNKRIPELTTTISIKNFDAEMDSFLSNEFYNSIKGYYSGTKFDFNNLSSRGHKVDFFALYADGDAGGFYHLGNRHKIRPISLLFNPQQAAREYMVNEEYYKYQNTDQVNTPAMKTEMNRVFFNSNFCYINMFLIYEQSDSYVYLTNGEFFWSIRRDMFDKHINPPPGWASEKNYILLEG